MVLLNWLLGFFNSFGSFREVSMNEDLFYNLTSISMSKDFNLHLSIREDSIESRRQRNSVDRIQNLKIELWKLRTSLSSAVLPSLAVAYSSTNLNGSIPKGANNFLTRNTSPIKIIEKFDQLQDKLKRAKQSLKSSSIK